MSTLNLSSRVIVVFVVMAMVAAMTVFAPAAEAVEGQRVDGDDRFGTAAEISVETFDPAEVDAVIIAAGFAFPDALSGSALAGQVGAPVLLVNDERDVVPAATLAELERLEPGTVHVLGGPAAVSSALFNELAVAGDWDMNRIGGADRFATAAEIAELVEAAGNTVIVATGRTFPDALAMGPLAYAGPHPVLLTEVGTLPAATAAALEGIDDVLIAGGPAAVSAAVENEIDGIVNGAVSRRAGAERTATAAAIADLLVEDHGWTLSETIVANGRDFPDALAGAAYAGARNAPLIITDGTSSVGAGTRSFVSGNAGAFDQLTFLGGPAAIPETQAAGLLQLATPDEPTGETAVPKLVEVEILDVAEADNEEVALLVRYTFDTDVNAAVTFSSFHLHAWDGTMLAGVDAAGAFDAEDTGRVPDDRAAVDVAFDLDDDLQQAALANNGDTTFTEVNGWDALNVPSAAITAASVSGATAEDEGAAVSNVAGANVPGYVAVGDVVVAGGVNQFGPELSNVGVADVVVDGDDRIRATFVFDVEIHETDTTDFDAAQAFALASDEGVVLVGEAITLVGEDRVRVLFDGTAEDVGSEEVAFAFVAANTVTADRDAFPEAASNTFEFIQLGELDDDVPVLESVTLQADDGRVRFAFNDDIDPADAVDTIDFHLVDAAGNLYTNDTGDVAVGEPDASLVFVDFDGAIQATAVTAVVTNAGLDPANFDGAGAPAVGSVAPAATALPDRTFDADAPTLGANPVAVEVIDAALVIAFDSELALVDDGALVMLFDVEGDRVVVDAADGVITEDEDGADTLLVFVIDELVGDVTPAEIERTTVLAIGFGAVDNGGIVPNEDGLEFFNLNEEFAL